MNRSRSEETKSEGLSRRLVVVIDSTTSTIVRIIPGVWRIGSAGAARLITRERSERR